MAFKEELETLTFTGEELMETVTEVTQRVMKDTNPSAGMLAMMVGQLIARRLCEKAEGGTVNA